ncbi:hypothetical protein FRUB_05319 [Fimbriiglobus ruber]|uniref:Uncharacterized protein n=1 Tax=Fimbriiglobus ruber TaxID=1908690 RepID=A0A225DFS9_9BACT|nr:hypothetical protein FRUB_05319 [Fimbriiglobus ruber]
MDDMSLGGMEYPNLFKFRGIPDKIRRESARQERVPVTQIVGREVGWHGLLREAVY